MNKQTILLAVGALAVFALLLKTMPKKQTAPYVYANNQYKPIWQGLPQDGVIYA